MQNQNGAAVGVGANVLGIPAEMWTKRRGEPPVPAAAPAQSGLVPIWRQAPGPGLWLQLGTGARPVEGGVNHDRFQHGAWIDVACDLDVMPWEPLRAAMPAGGFDGIVAFDVVEHIEDTLGFVNECHALLKTGGILVMRGGAADNPAVFTDPTHKHFYTEDSMDFFDDRTNLGAYYGKFYADSLGRPLARWWVMGCRRVNADPRYGIGDLQWTMVTE